MSVLSELVRRPGPRALPAEGDRNVSEVCSRLVLDVCAGCQPGGPVAEIVSLLVGQHRAQWAAEDRSRVSRDVAEMAGIKQTIDTLNSRRADLVAAVDEQVAPLLPVVPVPVPVHTETAGCVIDRLVIAAVRAERLTGGRQVQALRQLSELADAYDGLMTEVFAGARRLPRWLPLKSYGEGERA